MEVKVHCKCGQRYRFEVEPVESRLPVPVFCPACGADGTTEANSFIQLDSVFREPAPPGDEQKPGERAG